MTAAPLLLDSITDADSQARGCVVVSGSHGGRYAAYLAARAGCRAVILNDAGGGLDDAGIAGVMALELIGMAAAACAHDSCRIGDAHDAMARGTISACNAVARSLGLEPGLSVARACELLGAARGPTGDMPAIAETRRVIRVAGIEPELVIADSASLVSEADAGRIVITGSHGGLIGSDPARALKAAAALAVFNDAGYRCNGAGASRLPALDERQIAAATVSHNSARIGDALSAWEDGVISCTNHTARDAGLNVATSLNEAIRRWS